MFFPKAEHDDRIDISIGAVLAECGFVEHERMVVAHYRLELSCRGFAEDAAWAISEARLFDLTLIDHARRFPLPGSPSPAALDARSELVALDLDIHPRLRDAVEREHVAGSICIAERRGRIFIIAIPVSSRVTPLHAIAWRLSDPMTREAAAGRPYVRLPGRVNTYATSYGFLPALARSSMRLRLRRCDSARSQSLLDVGCAPLKVEAYGASRVSDFPRTDSGDTRLVPAVLDFQGRTWRRVDTLLDAHHKREPHIYHGAVGFLYQRVDGPARLRLLYCEPSEREPDSSVLLLVTWSDASLTPDLDSKKLAELHLQATRLVRRVDDPANGK